MRRLRTAVLAALLGAVTGVATLAVSGAPASADFSYRQLVTDDCRTVITQIADRPDSGTAGNWATDDFTRTVKICADASVPQVAAAAAEKWKYTAVAVDEGTFTTTGPKSPGHGTALAAGLVGKFSGGFSVTFAAPAAFAGLKTSGTATSTKSSGEWIGWIWPGSVGGDNLTTWGWTYTLCNEKWINAKAGNHGDITGLSRIPCYGNPSFTSKCDGTVVVLLTNAAPSSASFAAYWVSGVSAHGGVVLVAGGKPGQASVTAIPDARGVVTVKYGIGEHKTVKTYIWTKPKDCGTSPSPSAPAPSGSTPASPGLPVTGPNAAVYGGAAAALLVVGGALLLLTRRRRIRFQA